MPSLICSVLEIEMLDEGSGYFRELHCVKSSSNECLPPSNSWVSWLKETTSMNSFPGRTEDAL